MMPDPLPPGIVTPLVSFLSEGGEPDPEAMTRLVNYQVDNGIHGVLAIGSTGEIGALTPDQRVRAIQIVSEASADRVPVWAGVGGLGTTETVQAARQAAAAGANALLVFQPLFLPASDAELIRHFTMVADAVDVPIIAYDVPGRSPRKIPRNVMIALGETGAIRGFKDSSGDLNEGRLTVEATAHIDGFLAYIGSELTLDAALVLGFDGLVPGFANVLPRAAIEILEAHRSEDRGNEREAQQAYIDLFHMLSVPLPDAGSFTNAVNAIKVATAYALDLPIPRISDPLTQPDAEYVESITRIVAPIMEV